MCFDHVIFGGEKVKYSKDWTVKRERVDGYYFIYKDEKDSVIARWMAADKYGAARVLESFAEKYLKKSYWWEICYCHGYDVRGVLAWADGYCSDRILSILESWEQ